MFKQTELIYEYSSFRLDSNIHDIMCTCSSCWCARCGALEVLHCTVRALRVRCDTRRAQRARACISRHTPMIRVRQARYIVIFFNFRGHGLHASHALISRLSWIRRVHIFVHVCMWVPCKHSVESTLCAQSYCSPLGFFWGGGEETFCCCGL